MSSQPARGLYRTFLRTLRRMGKKTDELEIRKPVPDSWGSYGYSEAGLAYQAAALSQVLGPSSRLRFFPGGERLDAGGLRRLVRDNFRVHASATPEEAQRFFGEGLVALRALHEQLYMQSCSSSCTTEGVRIDATSKYSTSSATLSGRSQNLFSYRIRVINNRAEPIQVMGREWTIKNDKGGVVVHVPHAPGNAVVGQQPIIPPGDCFEYVSGTDLDTPAGLQTGRLEVAVLENGRPARTLMAAVAPFAHIRPDLHRQA
ncbi:hypothetical protein HYH03_014160 [Edaphochlamys debaryana]|uniref:ApaG domain-containing protein n=1 Tax=Edaphochlamys debaryana TaxID=47281 RepID=A0A836BSI9_9CHLO|nr:hypothetical protein HYH03_014160 [Edaphochlamys debaryana]|eukprot:KAG2487182.1 hypothetical protein HYH03_014160 [Edaphochlamys debaryana]